jgi:FkbM family methyltransferase
MSDQLKEVFSFEPSNINYERCTANYPPLQYPNIHFVNAAASESNGVAEFRDDGGSGACLDCETGHQGNAPTRKVRTVALESAPELDNRFGEVGFVKIDVQGHEPQVFAGMMKWLRDDSIAPPVIEFEFDPCLMRSAGTDRAQVLGMLQSLTDAGYSLADGKVSVWEAKVYAFQQLVETNSLPEWVTDKHLDIDAAIKIPELSSLIDDKAHSMAQQRPLGCGDLIDWYCPPDRSTETWRTYTDVIAIKRKKWQHSPAALQL